MKIAPFDSLVWGSLRLTPITKLYAIHSGIFMTKSPTTPILHTGMKPISSEHSKILTADDDSTKENVHICHLGDWDNPD